MNAIVKTPDSHKKLKLFQRYFNKAVLYQSQKNIALAVELYDKALYHNNNHLPTIQALGQLLQQSGEYDKALMYYHRAAQLHRHSATLNNAMGECYENCQQWDQAKKHYQKAIELREEYPEALNNLGNLLRKAGDYQQAEFYLLKSLRLCISVSTLVNLGIHMAEMHNYTQAHSFFDHALRIQPFNNKIKWYKALSLLTEGEFKQGWELYTSNSLTSIDFPQTTVSNNGEQVAAKLFDNKHVHIKGKQNINDEIMFASCVQEIATLSRTCTIECDERLVLLFQRSFEAVKVRPKSPNHMTHHLDTSENITLSLVNAVRHLRQSFHDFPKQCGHLQAAAQATELWKKQFGQRAGEINIGIAWRSADDESHNQFTRLNEWQTIFNQVKCQLVNLQHGQVQQELTQFPFPILDWPDCDQQNNIEQLAAQISALDLVVTANNTVAHLAGALGKTVWVILPYAANWRWFNGKNPCPWYSSARLFQVKKPGEWQTLFESINSELLKQ